MKADIFPDQPPFPVQRLYVHIPFCAGKCAYCDFYSVRADSVGDSVLSAYVDAVLRQAERWAAQFNAAAFRSIYVGGGTPTVLGPALLGRLVKNLGQYACETCEFTVEANPESLGEAIIDTLTETRVNRISLGMQTLSEEEWPILGRTGSVHASLDALERLVQRDLPWDLSADFLAGIPVPEDKRTGDSVVSSLARAADFVSHLSVYDLTIEEGTPLARSIRRGELKAPGEETLYRLRKHVDAFLGQKGFVRYEISNYARPGHESSHNAGYWNYEPYLGLGAGAVSGLLYPAAQIGDSLSCMAHGEQNSAPGLAHAEFASAPGMPRGELGSVLRLNTAKNLHLYMEDPAAINSEHCAVEHVGKDTAAFEFLMMGFRMRQGIDGARFARLFGCCVQDLIPNTLRKWQMQLVVWGDRLALKPGCLDILNRFLVDCLEEMDMASRPQKTSLR